MDTAVEPDYEQVTSMESTIVEDQLQQQCQAEEEEEKANLGRVLQADSGNDDDNQFAYQSKDEEEEMDIKPRVDLLADLVKRQEMTSDSVGESAMDTQDVTVKIEKEEMEEEEEGEDTGSTEDSEDSDDDGITITINNISSMTPPNTSGSFSQYGPVNLNITKRASQFNAAGQTGITNTATGMKVKPVGLDVDTPSTYNDQSIYDLNLDTLEDKPWRKPGADITDYFNYGFTEETWKIYCERQRRIRNEIDADRNMTNSISTTSDRHSNGMLASGGGLHGSTHMGNNIILRPVARNDRAEHGNMCNNINNSHLNYLNNNHSSLSGNIREINLNQPVNPSHVLNQQNSAPLAPSSNTAGQTPVSSTGNSGVAPSNNSEIGKIGGPSINENSKYLTVPGALGPKKAGPPPGRKVCGAIEVIGAGAAAVPQQAVSPMQNQIGQMAPMNQMPGMDRMDRMQQRPMMMGQMQQNQMQSSGNFNLPPPFGIPPSDMVFQGNPGVASSGPPDIMSMANYPQDPFIAPPNSSQSRFDHVQQNIINPAGMDMMMDNGNMHVNYRADDASDDGRGRASRFSSRDYSSSSSSRDDHRSSRGGSSSYRSDSYDSKERSRDKDRDSSSSRRRDRDRSDRDRSDRDREKRRKT